MISLDSSNITNIKQDVDDDVPEQTHFNSDIVGTNLPQLPYWDTNSLDNVIPLWPNVYDEALIPLLSHQQDNYQPSQFQHYHHHLSSSSFNETTHDLLSSFHSPCNITSLSSASSSLSPSASACSSLPSPISGNAYYSAPTCVTPISNSDICTSAGLSSPSATTSLTAMIPLTSLHHWTRENLIARVFTLEQELINRNSSESLKQDGWQCRWGLCDMVTSTLERLTDHLYRLHVGKGKAAYYCEWTGCTRHDKPFTKRHKMHNHLRTHTGERPFICRTPGCQKRFSRPDSLSTHQKTHSNVRPFICRDCGKTYFHARSLRKHLKASPHTPKITS